MRGHIKKRGKDSYSIVVSVGRDPATGKYKYQW
jgi:integrase